MANVARRILLVACLAGCADATDTTETRRNAVIDGTFDTTSGVVALVRTLGPGVTMCSGVLIAPQLVLTSRNCVGGFEHNGSSPIICGQTMFDREPVATELYVSNKDQIGESALVNHFGFTQAAEVRVPADADVCGNDIALLVLPEPLDSEPITPKLDGTLAPATSYTVHGYGPTSADGLGGGTRRSGPGTIVCVGDDCRGEFDVASTEFVGTDRACGADGGGPAIDTTGRAIGLVVRGRGECEESTHTSIPGWADWIKEHAGLAALEHDFEPAPWATLPDTGDDVGADAGTPDMGTESDDMGSEPQPTADAGGEDEGCSTAGSSPSVGIWALLGLGAVRLRRRIRCRSRLFEPPT